MCKIDDHLQSLKDCLLAGEFEQISTISHVINAAVSAEDFLPSAQTVELSARNLELLRAALSGVKSARRRIAEIKETDRGLTTYDSKGARSSVPHSKLNDRRC